MPFPQKIVMLIGLLTVFNWIRNFFLIIFGKRKIRVTINWFTLFLIGSIVLGLNGYKKGKRKE